MLELIIVIILVLWLLGNIPQINSNLPNGNIIHLLLVIVVIIVVLRLLGIA
jgi:hypothetical protein